MEPVARIIPDPIGAVADDHHAPRRTDSPPTGHCPDHCSESANAATGGAIGTVEQDRPLLARRSSPRPRVQPENRGAFDIVTLTVTPHHARAIHFHDHGFGAFSRAKRGVQTGRRSALLDFPVLPRQRPTPNVLDDTLHLAGRNRDLNLMLHLPRGLDKTACRRPGPGNLVLHQPSVMAFAAQPQLFINRGALTLAIAAVTAIDRTVEINAASHRDGIARNRPLP